MVCIFCGSSLTVTNSRSQHKPNQVWRRRQCSTCAALFTSVETIDLSRSLVVQYDTKLLELFQRDVLYSSVYEACKHRKHAATDATGLTSTIIARLLRKKYGTTITRNQLCTLTTEVLRRFDKAAAAQYKAYHPVK